MSKSKVRIGIASREGASGAFISDDVYRRSDGVWEVELSEALVTNDKLQIKLHREFGTFEAPVGASLAAGSVEARFEIGYVSIDGLQGELELCPKVGDGVIRRRG